MHCRRFRELPPTRRELLRGVAAGFGGVALTALLADEAFAGARPGSLAAPHHRPRARSVIFLYMDGGVSQIDSFDPKPRLAREHGQPFKMKI